MANAPEFLCHVEPSAFTETLVSLCLLQDQRSTTDQLLICPLVHYLCHREQQLSQTSFEEKSKANWICAIEVRDIPLSGGIYGKCKIYGTVISSSRSFKQAVVNTSSKTTVSITNQTLGVVLF